MKKYLLILFIINCLFSQRKLDIHELKENFDFGVKWSSVLESSKSVPNSVNIYVNLFIPYPEYPIQTSFQEDSLGKVYETSFLTQLYLAIFRTFGINKGVQIDSMKYGWTFSDITVQMTAEIKTSKSTVPVFKVLRYKFTRDDFKRLNNNYSTLELIGGWTDFFHPINIEAEKRWRELNRKLQIEKQKIKDKEKKIKSYEEATQTNPENAEAYYNLGVEYGKRKQWSDARAALEKALRISPDYTAALCVLGKVYIYLDRTEEALELFNKAKAIKPDSGGVYTCIGTVYGMLERYQESVEALKQAIRLEPDDCDARRNLFITYLKMGRKDAAREEYNILKNLDPDLANELKEYLK